MEIESEVYQNGRYKAVAVYDSDPLNPREDWEPMGTIVFIREKSGRFNLSDKEDVTENSLYVYKWNEELEEEEEIKVGLVDYMKAEYNAVAYIPLEYVSYSCADVRLRECSEERAEGIIYVSKEKLIEEYGSVDDETIAKAMSYMKGELETFNHYLEGEVFGFVVQDMKSEDDHVDSCWGFYGYDHKESGLYEQAKDAVDYLAKKEEERYAQTMKLPAWRFISETITNPF